MMVRAGFWTMLSARQKYLISQAFARQNKRLVSVRTATQAPN